MGRRGSAPDWDDSRDMNGSRAGRGGSAGPGDSGRYRAQRGDEREARGRGRLNSSQIAAALREAQQLQQDGALDEAVSLCEELLDSGVDRPDVRYFLGWLYQEADRWSDAAGQFETLLDDPEYALSCYYALGQCARAQGNFEDSAHYFDEAVDRVNLDALTPEESDQLLQLCQEAAEAHREMNDIEGAETVYTALLGFLRSQGWNEQVVEVERLMRETLGTEPPASRRRRTNTASRPVASNMPQRGGRRGGSAASSSGSNARPPLGDADGEFGAPEQGASGAGSMKTPSVAAPAASSAHLAAMPPAVAPMEALPTMQPMMQPAPLYDPTINGMGASYGAGLGAMGMGGAGGLSGAGQYYSSATPPVTASGDPLAQLIQNLSGGMATARASMTTLPEPQRAQVAQAVRDIENYVAHGLLTAAIEECLRVMEIAPQFLDVHLMLGEIYVRQGKIEQAIAKYAILIDTYLVNGRIDDAISTYKRILQLEPNNLTYRVKLIELLNRQGRMEEALQERMAAADSYLRLGYADRAIQEYEQALLTSPNNTLIRLNYALALLKAGRATQAIAEYQRVLQGDPSNINALSHVQIALASGVGAAGAISTPGGGNSNRVAALEALGRLLRALRAESGRPFSALGPQGSGSGASPIRSYEEVVKEYIQALEVTPANPDLRYALGQTHMLAGRQQEAQMCFQQAAQAPGFEALGRYAAGQAYLASGVTSDAALAVRELEEALSAIRRAPPEMTVWAARPRFEGEEHLAPENEVAQLLARAYQLSGQTPQQSFTVGGGGAGSGPQPALSATNNEVYRALAEVSARQLDPQGTLREYAQMVRQYRANRQIENAVTVLKEMTRLAPDDPAARSELADAQVSRGLLDEGLAELGRLADIHVRRGQLHEAAQVYQRMSEINWGMENRPEALNLLKQAMQYASEDMALRQQYVQYCLEVGRGPEAAEQQTVIARYYFASRQTKEAVAALQQLIGMDQHNYEAYDLLGQTYYSVGEYEQASRVYRNLAKVDPSSQMARARLQELQAVRAQMR